MNDDDASSAGRETEDISAMSAGETEGISAMPSRETDVLVVGGGPAGAAMGYWLAERGHDVTVVERKHFP
ncbi:MAG: hypothetical protein RIR54_577, partial [Actinomycetota bacterium]